MTIIILVKMIIVKFSFGFSKNKTCMKYRNSRKYLSVDFLYFISV
ncbi:hypothetical protein VCRA2116O373_80171 [Vibrio crassostreae]|nr:hypothetical protein VCRA2117O378_80173 [Vibrio crassostreae]CAK2276773.1 hypothetical protein VCRA2113O356_90171 [Vibrio crassostreae]CAK2390925.1 hypothetical protein VCRA2119O386_90171 [Vibrio crassostreae]CAK2592965.1 hypothetical protein VCRA2116O373_80171 [Vibrio crassostreae]CAK3234481.1 hypothetical protein VCRA2120O390_90170 [Vibrio crassostreae]